MQLGTVTLRKIPVVPKVEQASSQLVRSLQHPDRGSSFSSIIFSTDGKRLLAGGYPEGTVVQYDFATGSRLSEIATGKMWRGYSRYVNLMPDGKSFYVINERFSKIEYLEKDQKQYVNYIPGIGIKRWNVETGELLWKDTRPEQSRVYGFKLSPDGQRMVILEDPSGVYPRRTRGTSKVMHGDTTTGKFERMPEGVSAFGAFSPDSATFLTSSVDAQGNSNKLLCLDGRTFVERGSWPVKEPLSYIEVQFALSGERLVYIQSVLQKPKQWASVQRRLMILNYGKPDSTPQVLVDNMKEYIYPLAHHDQQSLFYLRKDDRNCTLKQVRLADRKELLSIPLPSEPGRAYGTGMTLSPNGKLLAITQRAETPKELESVDELKPEMIGQPRILLIEVTTGKIVKTLISPPAFIGGMVFSPDGKSLVSSGSGCLHVWDVSEWR
jgi:WD40 repeat protein